MNFLDIADVQSFLVTNPGRLEMMDYTTRTYDEADKVLRKKALVYLPAAYDTQKEERFPVVYLMHGGGGDEKEIFGGLEAATPLKSILDYGIETGLFSPMIVITPTYTLKGYVQADRDVREAVKLTHRFPMELRQDLISCMDKLYRTRPDRHFRAFGGFSMGSETTWSVFADCLKEIAAFIPMSGDYWVYGIKGSKEHPGETVDCLIEKIKESGIARGDYQILAFTGTEDIAYEAMNPMMLEMETRALWFCSGKNLKYTAKTGAVHSYEACWEYLYRAFQELFR